jgi:hypothetical protein
LDPIVRLVGLAAANTLQCLRCCWVHTHLPAVQMIVCCQHDAVKKYENQIKCYARPFREPKDNVPKPVFQTNAPIINNIIARFGD